MIEPIELDTIYIENCLITMARMPDGFVDLTVTSPPYDNMRVYNGFSFDFKGVAKELYRVTKDGGVVVWVVGDQTVKGGETLTSFRQALYFQRLGFNVETMIWEKTGQGCLGCKYYYLQNFEYMFIFVKGKPRVMNLIEDRKNKKTGWTCVNGNVDNLGKSNSNRVIEQKTYGKRFNIWRMNQAQKCEHPAPFPEALARDHIVSWSNEGDVVFDPFMGSGTTAVVADELGRRWVGSEISKEYGKIIRKRFGQ